MFPLSCSFVYRFWRLYHLVCVSKHSVPFSFWFRSALFSFTPFHCFVYYTAQFEEEGYTKTTYLKCRVLFHYSRGFSSQAVIDVLSDEGLSTTNQGIVKFLRWVEQMGSIERQHGSGRPSRMMKRGLSLLRTQWTNVNLLIILHEWSGCISLQTSLRLEGSFKTQTGTHSLLMYRGITGSSTF